MQKLDTHMPFGAWMDYWYREFCTPRLRESTQETYSNRIYKQIIPKIGHIPLDELKNNDLQAFYSHLLTEGRLINTDAFGTVVSNSHIRHIHSHCSAALDRKIAGIKYTKEKTGLQIDRDFKPNKGKRRKGGTGYIKRLSENCWQGRYSPVEDGKRKTYNVYAPT
ncbi:MAG: N-terminal phage integrase SAM-like domain-containing protein, partial [Eubacteriales bacterium]|nr:N-terminal phage integrase SAM-like domain-containing protein [Eubacteriales bacterium]